MITRFLIVMLSSFLSIVYGQKIGETKLQMLLKKAEDKHSEAVIIYQDNQLVAEKYFGVGNPDVKIEAMSCTKSIVGLSVACLMTDGLIKSLDTPIADFYPEWKQGQKKRSPFGILLI